MSRNTIKSGILLAAIAGLFVLIGGVVGRGPGMTIGLVMGFGFVGFSYWRSDTLAIRAARAEPVTEAEMPEYYAVVRELTQRANMPMPKLYVSPDMQPNAFATGRNPDHAAVAVTRGILQICDWDELRGVLAHEISHVANRDILISSIAAAVATTIMYIATMLRFAAIFGGGRDDGEGGNPLALLAMALLAPLAAGVLQMALSRSREFEADRTGARLIDDGEPLARALAKLEAGAKQIPMDIDPAHAQAYIVNPLSGRKMQFANLFRSHPPTEERIARLRSREWAS
jgi:heat shock protein HtpX